VGDYQPTSASAGSALRIRSNAAGALRFVILVGIISFFADFAHEGARGIVGPYLAVLGASGAVVGAVAGFGEFVGYGLRLVSGRLADRTRRFWPVTIAGYAVQMLVVPALALAGSWPVAAMLMIVERAGRATRQPARDVMLSHAGYQLGGYGWAFGLHQALDQLGALIGPLVIAGVLARQAGYPTAFAILAAPAACTLVALAIARISYPHPEEMETHPPEMRAQGLPRAFWIYLTGAALVGAGFADFSLIAYHFERAAVVSRVQVPLFYAAAMAMSGAGSLVFGRLFDRHGLTVLVPLTFTSALSVPLVFLGGSWAALIGAALWGLGMGVHESIVPAAVAPMVPVNRRASAYGLFTAGYGFFWFVGSALIGFVYDHSIEATVTLCVILELIAIPFFVVAKRNVK
jgi:predicted MFS family arabinose efflux permease